MNRPQVLTLVLAPEVAQGRCRLGASAGRHGVDLCEVPLLQHIGEELGHEVGRLPKPVDFLKTKSFCGMRL